jgi:hypothetical protein
MSIEVFVLGFDFLPSFSSGEVVSKRARVQSRSSECEPKGNLDGFLARLHAFLQNEGQARQNNSLQRRLLPRWRIAEKWVVSGLATARRAKVEA